MEASNIHLKLPLVLSYGILVVFLWASHPLSYNYQFPYLTMPLILDSIPGMSVLSVLLLCIALLDCPQLCSVFLACFPIPTKSLIFKVTVNRFENFVMHTRANCLCKQL